MKKLVGLLTTGLTVAIFAVASTALAGITVSQSSLQSRREAQLHRMYDHPLARVVQVKDVNVKVTTDKIMHSCCMPPHLVVAGDVVNVDTHPIDYVKFIFNFEDKNGKVVHSETVYNHLAASMNDDAEVMRILKEKPHFVPIAPGGSDHFAMSILTPMLPAYSKVRVIPEVDAAR